MISSPAFKLYSIDVPSISTNAVPFPVNLFMMKPSPPKNPAPNFFWKCALNSTPSSDAKYALFLNNV